MYDLNKFGNLDETDSLKDTNCHIRGYSRRNR